MKPVRRTIHNLCAHIVRPATAVAFWMILCANLNAQSTAPLQITIMSYNIYHGASQSGQDSLTTQAAAISSHRPDFVGLQEVDNGCRRSGGVDQVKLLARATGMHSAFGAHFDYQGGQYGVGLLSRYPLSESRTDRITLFTKEGKKETRALLSAVATLDTGTTIILATVHMGLNQQSRLVQAEEVVSKLRSRGGPVILTGDFNAEPGTPEIKVLNEYFANAGHNATTAFTYPVGKPVKTIDYIMIDKDSYRRTSDFRVLTDVPWSDHYPLLATVEVSLHK